SRWAVCGCGRQRPCFLGPLPPDGDLCPHARPSDGSCPDRSYRVVTGCIESPWSTGTKEKVSKRVNGKRIHPKLCGGFFDVGLSNYFAHYRRTRNNTWRHTCVSCAAVSFPSSSPWWRRVWSLSRFPRPWRPW